ncbi:MAG: V-type ATP synthase subunit I [Trueperaceae bacterium]
MSIATMSQLTVVGRKRIAQDLLSSLQSLGVVQIDPLESSNEALSKFALKDAERSQKEGWDAAVSKSAGLIDALAVADASPANRADIPNNPTEVNAQLAAIASQVDKLVAERADYRDELEVIKTYLPTFRDLTPGSGQLDTSRYLQTLSFIAPAESVAAVEKTFRELLEDRVDIALRPRGKDFLVTAVALKKDKDLLRTAVSRSGFSELALPDRYKDLGVAKAVHTMEERSQSLPKRLQGIDEELAKLATQHGGKLQAIHQVALNNQARYEKMMDMAESKYGFALQGWVPSVDQSKVVDSLKKQFGEDVVVESREADEHHDEAVPVKLENPGWVKPFEGLLSLFAPPKYGNFDPAWTIAIFFPLFFGIVVGDIGFGVIFLAIGLWLRRRGKNGKSLSLGPLGITLQPGALPSIGTVINWCAIWTIIWGGLYGELFGHFPEYWPKNNPIFYIPGHGGHGEEHAEEGHSETAAASDHSETDTTHSDTDTTHSDTTASEADSHSTDATQSTDTTHSADADHSETAAADSHSTEAKGKGIFPILIPRVYNTNIVLLMALGFGVFQVLFGWAIRTFYGLKHHDRKHTWEGIGMFAGLTAIVLFAWGFMTDNITTPLTAIVIAGFVIFLLGVVISGLPLMLVELISNSGAILSYLRLFAVGLSAALVANLATDLGFAVSGTLPVIGPILGIIVGLGVNILAVTLTIIGHTLQPLRLQYVEFFTKFGFYEENGRPYQPFKLFGGK